MTVLAFSNFFRELSAMYLTLNILGFLAFTGFWIKIIKTKID